MSCFAFAWSCGYRCRCVDVVCTHTHLHSDKLLSIAAEQIKGFAMCRMAGIDVTDIKQRSENDNDIYLVDNKCTQDWLRKTLNEHLHGRPIPNPGYSYHIWGSRGLISILLKRMSLTVNDIQLVQKKQYFMKIFSLIELAINFRSTTLQPGADRAKYNSHMAMIASLDDCKNEVLTIIQALQTRIDARNAAALAALATAPTSVPTPNAWRSRPQHTTEEPTQNTTQHV
jgi:hypothetical protein